MTVATPEPGGAVQQYDPDMDNVGLEDVDASDLRIPRINIDHDKAVFVDSLSKEEFPTITCVVLGLVKQRIMWPPKLEDDSRPQCKSPDNVHGFPNVDPSSPKKFQFPWEASNFDPSQAQPLDIAPGTDQRFPEGWTSNGLNQIPCDSCRFSQWGKDQDNKNTPPPCNEQHTYPILRMVGTGDDAQWVPSIFTVQRSAISNSRAFINSFAQTKTAFFTLYTGFTLTLQTKGRNEYCVPNFQRMTSSPTDRNMWGEYAAQFRTIRSFLRSAPRVRDESDGAPSGNVNNSNTAPETVVAQEAPIPPAQPAAQAAAPAPVEPTPAPAAQAESPAPAAASPAPPVVAAPAAPPTPPAAPQAQATPPAPPAPAAAPAPAPAAPPATAVTSQGTEEEELPF